MLHFQAMTIWFWEVELLGSTRESEYPHIPPLAVIKHILRVLLYNTKFWWN